jgi:hypothetical protein
MVCATEKSILEVEIDAQLVAGGLARGDHSAIEVKGKPDMVPKVLLNQLDLFSTQIIDVHSVLSDEILERSL